MVVDIGHSFIGCLINRRTLAAKADLTHVVVGFEDGTTELWKRHAIAEAPGPELGPLAGHTDLVCHTADTGTISKGASRYDVRLGGGEGRGVMERRT